MTFSENKAMAELSRFETYQIRTITYMVMYMNTCCNCKIYATIGKHMDPLRFLFRIVMVMVEQVATNCLLNIGI